MKADAKTTDVKRIMAMLISPDIDVLLYGGFGRDPQACLYGIEAIPGTALEMN